MAIYTTIVICLFQIEPYDSLGIQDSCGPMRGVCKELDFIRMKDFPLPGSAAANTEMGINKYKNLPELIGSVVNELKKKAVNYEEKVLLLPYGGELYYHEKWHWDKIYRNMKILMNYVNARNSEFNMNIHFGTLKDYFDAIDRQTERYNLTFPVISGDFYSYTKMYQYFTGYFTTRMFDKRLSREVQESLRAAEMMASLLFQDTELVSSDKKKALLSQLVEARQNLGLFLHHQAITGTSQANVVVDYEQRLTSAFTAAQSVLASALSFLVQTKEPETQGISFESSLLRSSHNTLTEEKPIPITEKGTRVVMVNSLAQGRTEVVGLTVKSAALTIHDTKGHPVKFDVEDLGQGTARVWFEINLPPVSLVVYTFKSDSSSRNRARRNMETSEPKNDVFVCENSYINATFSKTTGTLLSICQKKSKICLEVTVDWIAYPSVTGAYIMDSNTTIPAVSSTPTVTATTGWRHCHVKAVYDIVQVEYILPNTKGITGRSLRVELKTNLPSNYNRDLAMRLKTNIRNTDFYSDSNGIQMMRRKFRKHLPFGASIFPMTSMAFLESMNTRLVIHSSQPHGIISPERFLLDVFVDRVAPAEENGLPEGATDNKPTRTTFLFELESLYEFIKPRIVEAMLPSINTAYLNDALQHPIYSFFTTYESPKPFPFERIFMKQSLPCDVGVANLRTLADKDNNPAGTSLTLFRRAISCTKNPERAFCPLYDPMNIDPGNLFGLENSGTLKIKEMYLTQLMEKPGETNLSSINIKPMDMRTFLLTNK